MALVGNLIPEANALFFDFPACYAKIDTVVTDNYGAKDWRITVKFYADAEARLHFAQTVKDTVYVATGLTGDPIPTSYAYLKTLPEFAGWVDA